MSPSWRAPRPVVPWWMATIRWTLETLAALLLFVLLLTPFFLLEIFA